MSSLGSRLKKAREDKRFIQQEVADKLGISNGTLSGYERNYRDPDTATLRKLAELYEVSPTWLISGVDKVSMRTLANGAANEKDGEEITEGKREIKEKLYEAIMKLSDEDAEYVTGLIDRINKAADK